MTPDDVSDFFSRPIAFHRCLVRVAGGVTAGLLLSQALYWQRVMHGEWFYKRAAEWIDETGLTREEFQTARRDLVAGGLISYQVRGVPATGHYRVEYEQLISRLRDSRKLDCGIPANKPAGNPQTSLRAPRNLLTTEITKRLPTLSPLSADVFEKLWKTYPKRAGNNPRGRALKAWNARIREGADPAAMLAGAERYTAFCKATGKVGLEIVMMVATFLGADKPYEQGFEVPTPPDASKQWPKCRYCPAESSSIHDGIPHCGSARCTDNAVDRVAAPA